MALTVTADIIHSRARMSVDYTTFNSLGIFGIPSYKGCRVFTVEGLSTGNPSDASTLFDRAYAAAGVPNGGDKHPTPKNTSEVVGLDAESIDGKADDAVYVFVDYATVFLQPPAPPSGSTSYTIFDSSTSETTSTQIDPATGTPLQFTFKSVKDKKGQPITVLATLRTDQKIRRTSSLVIVPGSQAEVIRAANNCVNDSAWNGLPAGYWRITSVDQEGATTSTIKPATYYAFKVTAVTRTDRDWSSYETLRDPNGGVHVQIRANNVAAARNPPYKYGVISNADGAGFMRVGTYRTCNFKKVFPF